MDIIIIQSQISNPPQECPLMQLVCMVNYYYSLAKFKVAMLVSTNVSNVLLRNCSFVDKITRSQNYRPKCIYTQCRHHDCNVQNFIKMAINVYLKKLVFMN